MVEGMKIEGGLSIGNDIWGAKHAPPPDWVGIGSTDLPNWGRGCAPLPLLDSTIPVTDKIEFPFCPLIYYSCIGL